MISSKIGIIRGLEVCLLNSLNFLNYLNIGNKLSTFNFQLKEGLAVCLLNSLKFLNYLNIDNKPSTFNPLEITDYRLISLLSPATALHQMA
jgi:hypothetical protein